VFESCFELKPAFDILAQRPDKLQLVTGEMFPTARTLDSDIGSTPMEGVEHLGQYVYEMTQAKIKATGKEPVVVEGAASPTPDENEEEENDVFRESVLE
jgi:intron-binding protein aquarius